MMTGETLLLNIKVGFWLNRRLVTQRPHHTNKPAEAVRDWILLALRVPTLTLLALSALLHI